jgi:Flp pilus assembly protein TadD
LNPRNAAAYTGRGSAHQAGGDTEGAMADFNEAIRVDPSYGYA